MVTVPDVVSEFIKVIVGIVLVPLPTAPDILGVEDDVHAKVVPGTAEVSVTEVVVWPLHMV
jgi:hypothetical protein